MAKTLLYIPGDSQSYQDAAGTGLLTVTGPLHFGPRGKGLLVERSATNNAGNPSAETNILNWAVANTTTTRDTTDAAPDGGGTCCFALTNSSTSWIFFGNTTLSRPNATPGQIWSISAEVKSDPGKQFFLRFDWRDAAQPGGVNISNSDSGVFTGDGTWQRVTWTATAPAGTVWFQPSVRGSGTYSGTETVKIDKLQIELGSPTSYIDGTLGSGYAWTGTAHASTSTRALSLIRAPRAGHINPAAGSIGVRFRRTSDGGTFPSIVSAGSLALDKDRAMIWLSNANDLIRANFDSNNVQQGVTSAVAADIGTTYVAIMDWSASVVGLTVNGVRSEFAKTAPSGDLDSSNEITIGSTGADSTVLDGVIEEVSIFDGPLNADERSHIAGSSNWSMSALYYDSYRRRYARQSAYRGRR